jgi:hypothetical protein
MLWIRIRSDPELLRLVRYGLGKIIFSFFLVNEGKGVETFSPTNIL